MALAPIYLMSLFHKLDECIKSILKIVGRYHVVTPVDIAFFQLFLWERFKTLGPKSIEYDAVEMVEVEENGEVTVRPDKPYKLRDQNSRSCQNSLISRKILTSVVR